MIRTPGEQCDHRRVLAVVAIVVTVVVLVADGLLQGAPRHGNAGGVVSEVLIDLFDREQAHRNAA